MKASCLFAFCLLGLHACTKSEKIAEDPRVEEMALSYPCLPANLKVGVLAFYAFSGGSIQDFSGNAHHLNNVNGAQPATDRGGNAQCAFEFSDAGAKQFLTTSNTSFLNALSQFSVSLWYMPIDASRNGGKYEVLVTRDTGRRCDNIDGWSVGLFDCRRAVFGRRDAAWDKLIASAADSICEREVSARTGVWHHLAAVYDSQSQQLKVYRNGVLQEVKSETGNCSGSNASGQEDLFVGLFYTGLIDDIILYNRALSDNDVQQLSRVEPCCGDF